MAQVGKAQAHAPQFEGSQPILCVSDLKASVRHYVDVLGFKVDFHENIASV